MRTVQGWLLLKKVHSSTTAIHKTKSCWLNKTLAWSLGSQKEEVDTKLSWRWVYKDFIAPTFAATVVGEDSIQPLMLGLSVDQEVSQLEPGIRCFQVAPCKIKAVFVLAGQLLYALGSSSGSPFQGWGALLAQGCLANALEGSRFQPTPYNSSDTQPLLVQSGMWSQQTVRSGVRRTLKALSSDQSTHMETKAGVYEHLLWPEGGLEAPQLL